MKVTKKRLALLLALTLVLSALSPTAWAVEGEGGDASTMVAETESNAEAPVEMETPDEAEEPQAVSEESEPSLAEPEETVAEEEILSANAETSVVASGTYWDNLTWVLDSAGTLTISGTGAMADYSYGSEPW